MPATARQLQVAVSADPSVARPGQPVTVALQVTDASGQGARAQVSVGVVDEAVYGVRPDTTPDPLRFFYRREFTRVFTAFSRDYSFIGYSGTDQLLLARRHRPLTLADFKADRPERPQVRKEFPDTIYWIADLVTDASGAARVQVTYPDSLTTWRITARAVTLDAKVGAGVSRTLTTKDLILRVIAPRFLTEGDQVTVPTIVHNYLPSAKSVALTLQASGVEAGPGFSTAPQTVQVAAERSDARRLAALGQRCRHGDAHRLGEGRFGQRRGAAVAPGPGGRTQAPRQQLRVDRGSRRTKRQHRDPGHRQRLVPHDSGRAGAVARRDRSSARSIT